MCAGGVPCAFGMHGDRRMMRTAHVVLRIVGRALGLVVLSIVLAVGVDVVSALTVGYPPILRYLLHEAPFRGQRFDRQAWFEAASCAGLSGQECDDKWATCLRGPMVRDLVLAHLVVGASRKQVLSLLGAPETKVKIEGVSCDDYGLGVCSGLGWDYDSLFVCYAEDGTVARAGHVQH